MSRSSVLAAALVLAVLPARVWPSASTEADGGTPGIPSGQPEVGSAAPPGEGGTPAVDLAGRLSRADQAYAHRDQPGKLDELRRDLEQAERLAPRSYDVLWRLSRYYFWLSDDPQLPDGQRSSLGKLAWDHGDRATAANPNRVEGWFYGAGGLGNYSLGIGILQALSQGLEGKFKERLSRAQAIDPHYLDGGIENAWGRFYFKLPWPKYRPVESERHLLESLRINPANVRGRVYLAELYLKEDHPQEARALLEKALAQPPGQYDEPEERRYQERARALLTQLH